MLHYIISWLVFTISVFDCVDSLLLESDAFRLIAFACNALQFPCYLFSSLVGIFPEYRGIQNKKNLSNRSYNSVICCHKTKLLWSILNKTQQRGIPKRLVDKYGQKPVYKVTYISETYWKEWPKLQYFTLDRFLFTADVVTKSCSAK